MMDDYSNFNNGTFPDDEEEKLGYECPPRLEDTDFEVGIRVAVYIVIITISLMGNILIIAVTRRTRSMKTVAYNLIVNMAIADLFTTLINMPETVVVEIKRSSEWLSGSFGVVLCKLLPFCQLVCVYCSILSLLAIALDRFFAIVLPLKRLMTEKLAKILIFGTWLIPSGASSPMWIANRVTTEDELLYCEEKWPDPFDSLQASRDYTIILFVLFYVLPLIFISALYGSTIYKIWRRKVPGNYNIATSRLHLKSRKKALKMFIAVVVCFAICWLPYHVVFFLSYYNEKYYNCGIPDRMAFIGSFLGNAISAINPCVYMIFNKDYRNGAKRLLGSWWRKSAMPFSEVERNSGVHSRDRVSGFEMATFRSRSPQLGIRVLTKRKEKMPQESLTKKSVFLVHYNHGFVN